MYLVYEMLFFTVRIIKLTFRG